MLVLLVAHTQHTAKWSSGATLSVVAQGYAESDDNNYSNYTHIEYRSSIKKLRQENNVYGSYYKKYLCAGLNTNGENRCKIKEDQL